MSKTTETDPSNKTQSKLYIRSEVLAVIQHLNSLSSPSKAERLKQIKRLRALGQGQDNGQLLCHVQDILLGELTRATQRELITLVSELLMELGDGAYLNDRLWDIIRNPDVPDAVKDACNLILRHLGDTADPELYLEYLQDPQALINQETTRMISASGENPETLIDFIDFILSLNGDDQARLVSSLHRDYASKELVDMFVPLLESDPSPELWEVLVDSLGETKSPKAARSLQWLLTWGRKDEVQEGFKGQLPIDERRLEKALKSLQLAGAVGQLDIAPDEVIIETGHPVLAQSLPHNCYATMPDGIGNQGLLYSRRRENGDVSLFCLAINDVHGVIDCFGFYQLAEPDFHRIMEKFHEGTSKVVVEPEYIIAKVIAAETINRQKKYRLPYEYQCWRPLLGGVKPMPEGHLDRYKQWANLDWLPETYNLYQHPDFNTWFLEQGDEDVATTELAEAMATVQSALPTIGQTFQDLMDQLDASADRMMAALLQTPWRQQLQRRLQESAYLLHCQEAATFCKLAATEALKLEQEQASEKLVSGFVQAYGRRCLLEALLRDRTGSVDYEALTELIKALEARWGL
ncbi:MAG: hypothetical protein R2857_07070 [Vampirovibrionales bacterium]